MNTAPVLVTESIISPPVRKGGISSSSSRLPYSTPMPMGPMSLWPEKARKSTPDSCTSIGIWGALCAASTTTTAPRSLAMAAIWRMGFSHPSTLDTWVTATSLVRSVNAASRRSCVIRPSASHSRNRKTAPVFSAAICQGSKLLWCSMMLTNTSSPAFSRDSP